MLSKITLFKLLVSVRVFIFFSACGFDADSAKSTICESLSDNSFDEVCKGLETLLGSGTQMTNVFQDCSCRQGGISRLRRFIYCFFGVLVCIFSFIDIGTTARDNGVESGIYILITRDFFNNTK